MTHYGPVLLIALLCLSVSTSAQVDDADRQLSHDVFKELIEINTTDSVGNVTAASEAMARRLLDAGFPDADVQILGPNERKKRGHPSSGRPQPTEHNASTAIA